VPGLYVKSVKATVEAFNRESGIRIILDYQPGRDSSPRASLDGDGYPWANTSVEEISLIYGLREVIEAVSDDRTPRTFTFIFDDKQIHIVSVERAIEWWRKQVLSKNSNELKNTPDLPTVESCALIADPTQYDGREIRVTGVYSVCGTSDSKFFSSSCSSKTLWVEFAPNYQSCSDAKAISALTELRKKSGFRWARPHVSVVTAVYRAANVQFVGRFRASNPYAQEVRDLPVFGRTNSIRANYDFVLEVSCIERVKALPKDANY